ncbi:hypothetical protein F0562_020118 [Nyssa sinensis]|uniref:Uncharacterized protein n=1 Tax=Nyssa sinensis TaxID=561372 RepID=A0A5J5BRL1_9ASTE|nr:hypothetical protein F0562_020118 [Nyssa sinensis]
MSDSEKERSTVVGGDDDGGGFSRIDDQKKEMGHVSEGFVRKGASKPDASILEYGKVQGRNFNAGRAWAKVQAVACGIQAVRIDHKKFVHQIPSLRFISVKAIALDTRTSKKSKLKRESKTGRVSSSFEVIHFPAPVMDLNNAYLVWYCCIACYKMLIEDVSATEPSLHLGKNRVPNPGLSFYQTNHVTITTQRGKLGDIKCSYHRFVI